MAHKVLSKDMAELVSALKLAEKYSTTTLDNEYRKYDPINPITRPIIHFLELENTIFFLQMLAFASKILT